MTQQDLAMRAQMDRAYISEVENGKRSLSVDRLLRLCDSLDVHAADLIGAVERELAREK